MTAAGFASVFMLKSLIAGLFALLVTFGLHHSPIATAPAARSPYADTGLLQHHLAQVAAAAQATPSPPSTTTPSFQDLSSSGTLSSPAQPTPPQPAQPQSSPILPATQNSLDLDPLGDYITSGDLSTQINNLQSWIREYVAQATSTIASAQVPQQVAAGGNPEFVATAPIDNLFGTSQSPLTISNATLSNVSGLTASEIPDLSGQYLSLNGGAVVGTSTFPAMGIGTTSPGSELAVQGVANFTTATSTYYSTGGIDLAAGCFAIAGNCLDLGGGGAGLQSQLGQSFTVAAGESIASGNVVAMLSNGTVLPNSQIGTNAGIPVRTSGDTNGPNGTVSLNSTHFVVTYSDSTNNRIDTAVVGHFSNLTASTPIGIAVGAGSAGQSVNVIYQGIVGGFSNLTAGAAYYIASNGTVSTSSTGNPLGLAVSSTQVLLNNSSAAHSTTQFFGDAVFENGFRITEGKGAPQALDFLNQFGEQIASLDENGNLTISGIFSSPKPLAPPDAATTASSTIAASFSDASQALQDAIEAIGGTAIRVLGDAVQATKGIFNTLIAQVAYIDTANIQKLCVGSTCVTPDQFQAMVAAANEASATTSLSGQGSGSASESATSSDATDTPPVIQINGDNPAIVQVGAVYNDPGADITAPAPDLNLGIDASVDGGATTTLDQITVDTSESGTHSILYCATDQSGLGSCASRTVNVVAPTAAGEATTTAATSTSL